jgi:hypothetical protein
MYSVKNLGDKMILNQIKGVAGELEKLEKCEKPKDEKAQAAHDKEVDRVSNALQELISEAKFRGLTRDKKAKAKKAKPKAKRGMTGGSPNAQPVFEKKPKVEQTPNGSEQTPNKE